ncbi:DUF1996 domain-containing protein [Streptomyces sp. P1-3]|uniref:DUF1996 domain-containing protein n=1 Tax=Streptomyces sp. P1-3 TaxID=3421658 RepID=UPI003D36E9CA
MREQREQTHKRARFARPYVVLAAVLALGAGGVAAIAATASAGSGAGDQGGGDTAREQVRTVDCPDVGDRLRWVPSGARSSIDTDLAKLDEQVADAYRRLASGRDGGDAVLTDLNAQRRTTIDRIVRAMGAGSGEADRLRGMSACEVRSENQTQVQDQDQDLYQGQDQDQGQDQGQGQGVGPSRDDFVDITTVRPEADRPQERDGASTGTFTSACGRNENGHFNPDNVIVAPGVSNGAHHMHDYVGNESTDAFSTDESLAASGTTCDNGDQSTYYWPVLRLRDGQRERDADAPGGGQDANVGRILTPDEVTITFQGSPVGEVTAMPRFLRIITGDAKAFTNGPGNANASWSCTGFENRQLKDKYPLCPEGSKVVRTFAFQNCWDGRNTDSANHRTHVAFAEADGSCGNGFRAIPQLVQRIVYDVPQGTLFAVDSFPEQLHKPVTDHGDFINVMPDRLMAEAVDCVNDGRECR